MFLLKLIFPLIVFAATFAFFFVVMHPRKLGFLTSPIIASLYFLTITLLLGGLYRNLILPIFSNPTLLPFVALLGFYLFAISFYRFVRNRYRRPAEFIERHNKQSFIKLNDRFLFSKSFDILFQQTVVVILVLSLAQLKLSTSIIMLSFALLFGLTHLSSLAIEGKGWTFFFGLGAVLSALVFPPLILFVPYGFVYTFIIHWFFYVVGGGLAWMHFGGKKNV